MAQNKFCAIEFNDEEWTERPSPYLLWQSHKRDRSVRILEGLWQLPTDIATETATAVEAQESLEARFREQADKWALETAHLSSPTQRSSHPSYLAILGMAREDNEEIIRLMLRDLRDNRRLWFWALSYLTKENPIMREDAGKLDRMIKAWVEWGKQRGKL